MNRRACALIATIAALLAGTVSPALAAWNSSGAGSGVARAGQLQPPVSPRVSATSAGVRLVWSAPTAGAAPSGYRVTRNGTIVCATTATVCDDSNLAPSTTYTYLVTSTAGRWASGTPLTATATTFAGGFAFSAVSPSPAVAGRPLTFTLTATLGTGTPDSRYTGEHQLTVSSSIPAGPGGNASGGPLGATFVAGIATKITTTMYGSGTQTLTISDGYRTGALSITVLPGT